MATTVEFPEDRVYNNCKAMLSLDHNGHIPITYLDMDTGDDLVMVYLGREEIEQIVKLYIENSDFITNEGKPNEEATTKTSTPQVQPTQTP
jgi:hypothetical protein